MEKNPGSNPDHSQIETSSPFIEFAHKKAVASLVENAIDPKSFKNYGEANLAADMAYVEKRKKQFEADENKKLADIFEALFIDAGELNNWIGDKTVITKTAEYDDIAHGIDAIVEFEETENTYAHLATAIDVTFSGMSVREKLASLLENIKNGKLGTIKYFRSDRDRFIGEKRQVPQAIIGIERETVLELAGLWVNHKTKELESHPVQRLILEELLLQLKAFREFAAKVGQNDLVLIYDREIKILRKLLLSKQHIRLEGLSDDKVLSSLKAELANI